VSDCESVDSKPMSIFPDLSSSSIKVSSEFP
jgi:hypothetical protein